MSSCRTSVSGVFEARTVHAQFLLDESSGALKALRPMGEAEFLLAPRELPQLMSFGARLDSSLRAPLAALSNK